MNDIIQYTANRLHSETTSLIQLIVHLDNYDQSDINDCLAINADYLNNVMRIYCLDNDMTLDTLELMQTCLKDNKKITKKYFGGISNVKL